MDHIFSAVYSPPHAGPFHSLIDDILDATFHGTRADNEAFCLVSGIIHATPVLVEIGNELGDGILGFTASGPPASQVCDDAVYISTSELIDPGT